MAYSELALEEQKQLRKYVESVLERFSPPPQNLWVEII